MKKQLEKNVLFIVECVIMILICYLHALSISHYLDFSPMNGTFQNYNPIRRFLAGQIPYSDFQDYLGLGHLYSGSFFTWIFGGDYQASVIAFSFLAFFTFALFIIVIGAVIIKKKEDLLALCNLILVMVLVQPLFFKNAIAGLEDVLLAINCALETGNSARFLRAMVLPLTVLMLLVCVALYQKSKRISKIYIYRNSLALLAVGIISGFAFLWSNDYGISCWICLILSTVFIAFARCRNIITTLKALIYVVVVSLLSICVNVQVFTLGHFREWFKSLFRAGGWQTWYYNAPKSCYLYDVDFSFTMLLQATICIFYLYMIWKNKGTKNSIIRYGVLAYANMSSFCAANEYKLLSGGTMREVALTVLFLTVIIELYNILMVNASVIIRRKLYTISVIVCVAWIGANAKEESIFWNLDDKEGDYVESLGGNMRQLSEDLQDTSQFLKGKSVFATYASAQEVVEGMFQPTGTDYIIHVLGDEARSEYLKTFSEGNFDYAATIKDDYTLWEYWVQRANWFFYRELYAMWRPVYANSYEIYWEPLVGGERQQISSDFEIITTQINEDKIVIKILCDESVDGIADLYVKYDVVKKNSQRASLILKTLLKVENTGNIFASDHKYESNYLRSSSAEYIPVTIVDGYGEVTLTSCPQKDTKLNLEFTQCDNIFITPFKYLELSDVQYNEEGIQCLVNKNGKNAEMIKDIKGILIDNKECLIHEISMDDEFYYLAIRDIEYVDTKDISPGRFVEIIK